MNQHVAEWIIGEMRNSQELARAVELVSPHMRRGQTVRRAAMIAIAEGSVTAGEWDELWRSIMDDVGARCELTAEDVEHWIGWQVIGEVLDG